MTRQKFEHSEPPRQASAEGRALVLVGLVCTAALAALVILFMSPDVRSAIWQPGVETKISSGFDSRSDPPVGTKVLNAVFAPRYILLDGGV